ncbi:EF-hand domain-containing protein [Halomonas desiderata]|uniref:EF-hand domain-containing protein n=1 Tax=Billgrantia desiderata TaxID=52021 RepID=UPI001749A08A|nr:EF-hand domain-containing protein [Halomonas desiderata]
MKLSIIALCLALAAVSGAALAERPSPEDNLFQTAQIGTSSRPNVVSSFDEIDTDHNGYISATEASRASMAASFGSLDRNLDGLLSREEYEDHHKDH